MILGTFRDGHPRITLLVIGRSCRLLIEFILDTGFEGDLVLPAALVSQLDRPFTSFANRMLADGSIVQCRMLDAIVDLEDESRPVSVLALGEHALIGTKLFKGFFVQIEMDENGEVTAEEM
jgi:clan AA aspartic protease